MTASKRRVLNETAQRCADFSAVSDPVFWEKTRVEGDCLVYTGYRDRQGYGKVFRKFVDPSPMLTHRYVWFLQTGEHPGKLVIRHTCDNPPCVLPDHLRDGTQADNIADRQARGRHRPGRLHGIAHPAHRLTEAQVRTIRRLASEGVPRPELAAGYGMSRTMIRRIVLRLNWKHLEDAA